MKVWKNKFTAKIKAKIQIKNMDEQFEQYKHNIAVRRLSFTFIKRSWGRIAVVWLSIFASSILVLLSTMVPVALNNVKKGMTSQFGSYNSYSEYQNNALNVPIPKFNMQEQYRGNDSQSPVSSTDPYGGTDPINDGIGTDNRYDLFRSNDPSQISFDQSYFNYTDSSKLLASLGSLGYLGGIVLSSSWILGLKDYPLFSTTPIEEVICGMLGAPVPDDPSKGVYSCIEYVVNQNAPAYIRQKLFAESNPNFYLSFGKLAYFAEKDGLFTYIDGAANNGKVIKDDNKIKLWGIEDTDNFQLKNIKGENLLTKLYESAPEYQGSDAFPVVLNLSAYNSLMFHHQIEKNDKGELTFKYKVPYNVVEVKHDNKWYVANANKYYYHLNNGESVYYERDNSKKVENFNGSTDQQNDTSNLVDALDSANTALGNKMRITTFTQTVTCIILGVADRQLGTARIYTTHMAANEMSGYYSPNNHYFYNNVAQSFWLNKDNTNEILDDNGDGTSIIQDSIDKGMHYASDGHPDKYTTYNFANSQNWSKETAIGQIPGGYGLYSTNGGSDTYFNGKLTKDDDNPDLTNFTLYNPFGAYDRFGLSTGYGTNDTIKFAGWDPTNVGGTPFFSCTSSGGNCINDNSANHGIPNIFSLFSKQLVTNNIDRIIILVLSILYVVLIFLLIISLIIILVSTNIIIDDNKKNISVFKVMGYSDKDISRLFLGVYKYVVLVAFLAAIPIVVGGMFLINSYIAQSVDSSIINLHSHISEFFQIWQLPVAAIIVFLIFFVNLAINKKILEKIRAIDVLKR